MWKVTDMMRFIEVTDIHNSLILINVDEISYLFISRRTYCTIVLKGSITIETNMSYDRVKGLL